MSLTKITPLKWFVILSLVAIALALGLPPDPKDLAQLNTTSTAYRLAVAALLVPYLLIWYASFYAYAKLKEYSAPLRGTKDGEPFRKITIGIGILAFGLVVPTIISLVLNNVAMHDRSYETTASIVMRYLTLFPGVLAFLMVYSGSRDLLTSVRGGLGRLDFRWHAPWFLLLGVVFAHLTIQNHFESDPYHLPLGVLIVTVIVPYLYGWVVGLLGAYNLKIYASAVKGSLYKKAVRQFATGITMLVVASIAIQFITLTLQERYKNSLGAILVIDYVLLMVILAGLIFMALGTRKLKRIEEV